MRVCSLVIDSSILFLLLAGTACAQIGGMHTSPRSFALSSANIADPHDGRDANPALSADTDTHLSADYMPSPLGLEGSWTAGASMEYPLDPRNLIGVSFDIFQNQSVYSNENLSAQYSRSFGNDSGRKAEAGVRIRYSNADFGQYYLPVNKILIDVGSVLPLVRRLTLGVAIVNLIPLYRSQDIGADVRSASLGLTYRPLTEFAAHAAIESAAGSALNLHGGMEYDIEPSITLRIGIESLTGNVSGGVGLRYDAFVIDFGLVRRPVFGDDLSFGLSTNL